MRRTLIFTTIWTMALMAADPAREQALQKAIDLMETKGDLPGATRLFEEAARSSDRAVAARALLYLGQCQERQGAEKARATYQRIERDFSDQRETVGEARRRLAALGTAQLPSATLSARLVWRGQGVDPEASITPDGQRMAMIDWSTGDLAIRDMGAGKIERLLAKTGSWEQSPDYGEWPVLSRDQKQIAYAWFSRSANRYQLRVMANQRGAEPRILIDNPEFEYFEPTAWSVDGKSVLATLWKGDNTAQLSWVSARDGSIRTLKSLEWRRPTASLSPDGKYVAYSALASNASTARDIYLLTADGTSEFTLAAGPALNSHPVWSPDGGRILFTSDRAVGNALWSIRVKDGRPYGEPELVRQDVGRPQLKGFTRSGSLVYLLEQGGTDFLMAEMGQSGAMVRGDAVRVKSGPIISPSWSPDGGSIAFHATLGAARSGPGARSLVIRVVKSGVEKVYPSGFVLAGPPTWSRDGQSILQATRDKRGNFQIQRLSLNDGRWSEVLRTDLGFLERWVVSPDGGTVYGQKGSPEGNSIIAIDIPSGRTRTIYQGKTPFRWLALSGDGGTLAIVFAEASGGPGRRLYTIRTDGSGLRQLWDSTNPLGAIEWSRDGQWILCVRTTKEKEVQLWRVPSAGGEPEYAGLTRERITGIRLSDDGSRIVFGSGTGQTREYWALDNLAALLSRSR